MPVLRYLPNVVTLELDVEKCIGCGMCTEVCPHAVFAVEEKKVRIADRDACMECGACALNCPVEALSVNAGVGCAAAIIMSATGSGSGCDCSQGTTTGKEEATTCAPAATEVPTEEDAPAREEITL